MDLYDRIRILCDAHGISFRALEKAVGIGHGSINRWHEQMPRASSLQRVADYFGVSVNYLLGKEEYYADPEVSYMAQQLKDRPELKVLFDASKTMTKDDIEFVIEMIEKMRK